jgi:hypothetical protein
MIESGREENCVKSTASKNYRATPATMADKEEEKKKHKIERSKNNKIFPA